jgi:hypothetical protein
MEEHEKIRKKILKVLDRITQVTLNAINELKDDTFDEGELKTLDICVNELTDVKTDNIVSDPPYSIKQKKPRKKKVVKNEIGGHEVSPLHPLPKLKGKDGKGTVGSLLDYEDKDGKVLESILKEYPEDHDEKIEYFPCNLYNLPSDIYKCDKVFKRWSDEYNDHVKECEYYNDLEMYNLGYQKEKEEKQKQEEEKKKKKKEESKLKRQETMKRKKEEKLLKENNNNNN